MWAACSPSSSSVRNGPVTQQDRWEEDAGYSPFTLAVEVSGLLAAADLADAVEQPDIATYLRETADCWNESYVGAPADGSVWARGDCSKRVLRGGSWSNVPEFLRSAARNKADAAGGDFDYSNYAGFRVARTLP